MTLLEVFRCPSCEALTRVGWSKNETSRKLPCIVCYRTVTDYLALQKDGSYKLWTCAENGIQYDVSKDPDTVMSTKNPTLPVSTGLTRNVGSKFDIVKGEGLGLVVEGARIKCTVDDVEYEAEQLLTHDRVKTNKAIIGQTIVEI